MEAIRIQADAILVSPTVTYRPGQIVVRDGKIVSCSADCSEQPDLQLDGCMLSAGLVNAHTHLEFSDLREPFAAGKNFPEWIGSVIRHRRRIAEGQTNEECIRLRQIALQTGFEESRQAGVALIGDIVTRPWSPDDLSTRLKSSSAGELPISDSSTQNQVPFTLRNGISADSCLKHLAHAPSVFAFPEIIGLDEPRFVEAAKWAMDLAAIEKPSSPICRIGLSPHAPYSIHFPTAVKELAPASMYCKVTAMHVAESLDERQWLEEGTGPFREVFEKLGVPADAPRASIAEICLWLVGRQRVLLIHGNYLNQAETDLLARFEISIVYCPRTHRHFGHSEYPLRRFMNSRINVVLGTDSRASNPDLDLWNEVIALRETHPWVRPEWAFGAVTERSAEAVGLRSQFGTLHIGRVAFMNVSRFDSNVAPSDLLDELTTRPRPFTPLADILTSPPIK